VHDVRVIEVDGQPELSLHVKLPASIDLAAAHELASIVEHQITEAVPELADVHTHLEPLARPVPSARPPASATERAERTITALVTDVTGHPPRRLAFREGDEGLVALLTVTLDGDRTLEDAHRSVSSLEQEIRAAVPTISVVIVHTEPVEG
jgi:divalent metal cation (Fe/Co/Zn/Cd) transporter